MKSQKPHHKFGRNTFTMSALGRLAAHYLIKYEMHLKLIILREPYCLTVRGALHHETSSKSREDP